MPNQNKNPHMGIFLKDEIILKDQLFSFDERRTCPQNLSWEVSFYQYRMDDMRNKFLHEFHHL